MNRRRWKGSGCCCSDDILCKRGYRQLRRISGESNGCSRSNVDGLWRSSRRGDAPGADARDRDNNGGEGWDNDSFA